MNKFQILLSCVNQKDKSILAKSNINCNAIIINQCNQDNIEYLDNNINWIDSKDRGLSKSRNLAIKNSEADICLIADDDETFYRLCEKIIIEAFDTYLDYDVIIFNVDNLNKKNSKIIYDIGYLEAMRISSIQIAFRRDKIVKNNIWFDEQMGSGTGNGGGEENKFLFDCLKAGLKIRHVPLTIGKLNPSNSIWQNDGFSNRYFQNRGWSSSRYLGKIGAILYAIEFCVMKYPLYRSKSSFVNALINHFRGIRSKR